MSFADFKDNTMRAVVSKTIDGVLKYVNKHDDRTEALLKLTDLSEKLMGDKFEKKVFDGARNLIHNPDAKWMKYTNKVLDEIDPHVAKMHALNLGRCVTCRRCTNPPETSIPVLPWRPEHPCSEGPYSAGSTRKNLPTGAWCRSRG